MSDEKERTEPVVRVSSLETLKRPSIRTVQLEFYDDHECVAFDVWWKAEGQRVFEAWVKSR